MLRGLKYKILLTDKTSFFLPSITNSITIRFLHKCYPVFLGNFRALSHRIFGNFIFLCWLWAFKLLIEEKDLFGCQNCHLHTTTDDSRCPTFVQLETDLFFKFTWMQHLVQFCPVVLPFLFFSFTFSSSNTSIFSESIFWSSDYYRNCLLDLIVWDRSTGAPINCFCLFVCL